MAARGLSGCPTGCVPAEGMERDGSILSQPPRPSAGSSSHHRDLPGCVMGPALSRKVASDQDSHSDLSLVSSLGHLSHLPQLGSGEKQQPESWDAVGLPWLRQYHLWSLAQTDPRVSLEQVMKQTRGLSILPLGTHQR